jgi:hypothetical protein
MNRLIPAALCLFLASSASAACVNKFTTRSDGPRQIITFLTGKLTFQEAQALSADINQRRAEPIEWVDDKGKTLARQHGELKVVRPMPVACDGKPSGVIMIAAFPSLQKPTRKMNVKLVAKSVVVVEEQQ